MIVLASRAKISQPKRALRTFSRDRQRRRNEQIPRHAEADADGTRHGAVLPLGRSTNSNGKWPDFGHVARC